MALYKDSPFLKRSTGGIAFEHPYKPGTITPLSGISRCEVCGVEVVASAGSALPSMEGHKKHGSRQREAHWQLIVSTH